MNDAMLALTAMRRSRGGAGGASDAVRARIVKEKAATRLQAAYRSRRIAAGLPTSTPPSASASADDDAYMTRGQVRALIAEALGKKDAAAPAPHATTAEERDLDRRVTALDQLAAASRKNFKKLDERVEQAERLGSEQRQSQTELIRMEVDRLEREMRGCMKVEDLDQANKMNAARVKAVELEMTSRIEEARHALNQRVIAEMVRRSVAVAVAPSPYCPPASLPTVPASSH
jgi:hypothetical protein